MTSFAVSLKRAFKQPAFLVAVLLLAFCAATLNTAFAYFKVKFVKQRVDLRVPLREGIPMTLGNWISVSKDQSIDPETEQVLATSQYIFRDYVDGRKVNSTEINAMKTASPNQRDMMVAHLQAQNPSAVIRMAITYYTGLVDTVAHVPERCYVADGFEVKESETVAASLGNFPDGSPRDVKFTFLNFEDQTGVGSGGVQRVSRNVGYLFHCNGQYDSSAAIVRTRLQNLFEPFGYYAKVELMTAAPLPIGYHAGAFSANNRDQSVASMEDFLSEASPRWRSAWAIGKPCTAKRPLPQFLLPHHKINNEWKRVRGRLHGRSGLSFNTEI